MSNEKKLLIIIIFCLCSFTYANYKGNIQEETYKKEANMYLDAKLILHASNNGKGAIEILDKLQNKYPNNYIFQIDIGHAYMLENEFLKAQIEFEKALKQRPTLDSNASFLYKYGQTLHENKEYAKAEKILEKAEQLGYVEKEVDLDEVLKEIQIGEN